ncbi:MAG: NAD(P)/FAD-dependent oxidoreductase [Anaerolineae bacterium]
MTDRESLKLTPYWTDPLPDTPSYTNRPLASKTDALVIGGGYTGMVAALRLRQHGLSVTLVEKERMGWGASSRNGGMALPGAKFSILSLVKMFGRQKALEYFASTVESVDCVANLVAEGNLDCDFNRSGHLAAAAKPAHFEMLQRNYDFLAEHLNYTTRLLPPADMSTEIGSEFYHGGIVDSHGAGLDPAKYIAGLTGMADAAGVDLRDGLAATRIERAGGRFTVTTTGGATQADLVLVATNGYTGAATPWLQRRIIPIGSYIIATEPLPPDVARALIPNRRMIYDTKNFLFYFRLSPDGRRLLFGGRAKFTTTTLQESARLMHRSMLAVYPQLKDCRLEYAWSGNLGFTFDRFPHLGRHEGIFYALGYCGHGVAWGTCLGEKAARLMLGGDDHSLYTQKEFITVPFYRDKPWFLPLAQLYFKTLDIIG